jgi:hypothetical protein
VASRVTRTVSKPLFSVCRVSPLYCFELAAIVYDSTVHGKYTVTELLDHKGFVGSRKCLLVHVPDCGNIFGRFVFDSYHNYTIVIMK